MFLIKMFMNWLSSKNNKVSTNESFDQVKLAGELAKEKNFDGAIDMLHNIYSSGGASSSNVLKILPYYQKAGRYLELHSFFQNTAIPLIKSENDVLFGDKCQPINDCFLHLEMSKL